jgi:hypothetical protein
MKNQLIHSLLTPARTALAAAALLALPAISHAAITNGGFESGTTGWTETGGSGNFGAVISLPGQFEDINPTEGLHFGVIATDGPIAAPSVQTDGISQSFTISGDSPFLVFDYRFLTDGYNDPFFNPSATAILTPSLGAPITLFAISRNDLQAGGDGDLLAGASYLDVQTIGQSIWQTLSTDLSSYAGQSVTLSFSVNNGGDTDYLFVSKLAIDDVRTSATPVPEPGTYAMAIAILSLVGVRVYTRSRQMHSA